MKIEYTDGAFVVRAGKASLALSPGSGFGEEVICATFASGEVEGAVKTEKALYLPGEYEISGILLRGLYTDNRSNVVYKVTFEDIALADFGFLQEVPMGPFFEDLGENVSVAVVRVSETFDAKKAKDLLDKVGPRYALVMGDEGQYKDLTDRLGAKKAEESAITVSKSAIAEDRMDVVWYG